MDHLVLFSRAENTKEKLPLLLPLAQEEKDLLMARASAALSVLKTFTKENTNFKQLCRRQQLLFNNSTLSSMRVNAVPALQLALPRAAAAASEDKLREASTGVKADSSLCPDSFFFYPKE